MKDEIVVICPELTAGVGGLADYTLRMAEHWRGAASLRFLVASHGGVEPNVENISRDASSLREKLPSNGGKVLLQYSAYGFDRFGYPRWLLHALTDWKAQAGGRLVVMFHEIWTFWPVLNKNFLVQQLHRRDLGKLLTQADAVFTSTASQADHLRELQPGCAVQVLPVGSNIRVMAGENCPRDEGLAVLFGLQGARLRALRELHAQLKLLTAAGKIIKLVTLGGGNSAEGDKEERALLSELKPNEGFEQRGSSSETEVSALLSQASLGLSDQDELSLTKSGTFMAYAAHRLNIVSRHADPAKPEPLCYLTHPAELLRGVSRDELESRAQNLRSWQERTSSWDNIAEQFARALQWPLPVATRATPL